jgi:hypothetical protein
MLTKSCVPALLVCFCLGNGQAPADEPKPPAAIITTGERSLFDGQVVVKVTESDGKLNYSITRHLKGGASITTSPPKPLKKEGASWVIFPETAGRIWIFWDSALVRWDLEVAPTGTTTNSKAYTGPAVLKNAPKAVLERLPKEVVEKLKGM